MKKFFKLLALMFALLVLLVMSLMIWLNTNNSKITIINYAQEYLTEKLGYDLTIEGLKFSLPIIISAENIKIYDQKGEFAKTENFHLSIVPSIQMLWKINIWNLSASKLEVARAPLPKKISLLSNKESSSFGPNISIKKIEIDKIILAPELSPIKQDISYRLNGKMSWKSAKGILKFESILTVNKPTFAEYLNDTSLEKLDNFDAIDNRLDIQSTNLASQFADAKGKIFIDFKDNKLSGEMSYTADIDDLLLSNNLKGARSIISGNVILSGTLNQPVMGAKGEISLNLPEDTNFHFPDLKWQGDASLNNGVLSGVMKLEQGLININTELSFANKVLSLKAFEAKGPGFLTTANVALDINSNLLSGTTKVITENSSVINQYLPFITNGKVDLIAGYSSNNNKKQSVVVNGYVKDLQTKYGSVAILNIIVNVIDLWNIVIGPSKIDMETLAYEDITLEELKLSALSRNNAIKINAKLTNKKPNLVDIKFSSLLSFQKSKNIKLNIYELAGTLGPANFHIGKPVLLESTPEEYSADFMGIKFANGQIDLSGKIISDSIEASINFNNVRIGLLPLFLPRSLNNSSLTGRINLQGTLNDPMIQSSIKIENVAIGKGMDNVVLELNSDIKNNNTKVRMGLTESNNRIANMELLLPTNLCLSPYNFTIYKDQPFLISFLGQKPFDFFAFLPINTEHKIKGQILGNLKATGSLNEPQLKGKFNLENGLYEYERYGIKMINIKSEIIARNNEISIPNVWTEDEFGNKLVAKGEIALSKFWPFKFSFLANKFNLGGNPNLQGFISGKIDVMGNKEKAKASGNIDIGPFEIKIPEHFRTSYPELNITKVIGNGEESLINKDQPYEVSTDILVKAKEQVYVRGWGVDTLLKGKISIRGSTFEPSIKGKLSSIKGKYREFGKELNVEKGELIFEGKIPPSPYLNIVGVTTQEDTKIRLILSGSLFNPSIEITSSPALSNEDALSFLLFGKNPSNISAFQALQLANSLRKLSGHGSGIDPLGIGRKVLGVDDISIKTDDSNSSHTVLGIGKHLTDRVYLEVEEGGEAGSKTRIEVEITPSILIENVNKTNGGTSLGVKWRYNY